LKELKKILVIQTSFLGDVILATSMAETLRHAYPQAVIHMLVRKGNEGLLHQHPFLKVWIWDKKGGKYKNLVQMASKLRSERFDAVFNPHRFGSSGFITWMTGAPIRSGFDKNPFSFAYTHRVKHAFDGIHETERNHRLVAPWVKDPAPRMPALYPTPADHANAEQYTRAPYRCIAPTSVWFTKQWPATKWVELIDLLPAEETIYLLGAKSDLDACQAIASQARHPNVSVLAGKLGLLESVALMSRARMNYVNDSAPLHMASATNAPVRAVFCSTITAFGFGPLSTDSKVVELQEDLYCRPCGLHGYRQCPEGHFRCALDINVTSALQ